MIEYPLQLRFSCRLFWGAMCLAMLVSSLHAAADAADKPEAQKPGAEQVKLPGIMIDTKNKRIDVDATIALEEGLLEVIACIADTREHESIVIVDAVPSHIHAALLLIGADNGHPARYEPANEERTKWRHVPPRGDPIAVSLVYPAPEDEEKTIERPISDFIKRAEDKFAGQDQDGDAEDPAELFDTFIFAGSHVHQNKDGERQYIADVNGNVVSISTFGDEVLCLPARISQDNAALIWTVDDEYLPEVGTKVKLRLTLKKKPDEQGEGDE